MTFLTLVIIFVPVKVGDERLGVMVPFSQLRTVEAATSRLELARLLMDVLFTKVEQATLQVGSRDPTRQLTPVKLDAL